MKLVKKFFSAISISTFLCASVFSSSIVISAETEYKGTKYNDYLYYEKVAYGPEGDSYYIRISDCEKTAKEVVVPIAIEGIIVSAIGREAFSDTDVEFIGISDSVTSIDGSAFSHCESLKEIRLSQNARYIPSNAFYGCTSLENITIPNSVESIDFAAFWECTSLKEITFGEGLEEVGDSAFSNCTSLKNVVLPKSLKEIEECAFSSCDSLESIVIKNPECDIDMSIKTISNNIFNDKAFTGIIYGYEGSTAQTYAETHGYEFKVITADMEESKLVGDANEDGLLNVRDCAFIALMLAQGKVDNIPIIADYTVDDKINVRDAAAIAKYLSQK